MEPATSTRSMGVILMLSSTRAKRWWTAVALTVALASVLVVPAHARPVASPGAAEGFGWPVLTHLWDSVAHLLGHLGLSPPAATTGPAGVAEKEGSSMDPLG